MKDGARVAVLDVDDELTAALDGRDVFRGRPARPTWRVGGRELSALARLPALVDWLPRRAVGGVSQGAQGTEREPRPGAALDAGLADGEVVGFSATHNAPERVVPRAKRIGRAVLASPYDGGR